MRVSLSATLLALMIVWGAGCSGASENPAAAAQEEPVPQKSSLVPEAEAVTSLLLTEGPTVDREGTVYYTVGGFFGGKIVKWTDGPRTGTEPGMPGFPGRVEIFRDYGAGALVFDPEGRLLAADRGPNGDRPGVTRTDVKTGKVEWLAERYQGKRFSGPNDLTIDGKGRIYFTDRPNANTTADQTLVNAVYRVDPDGTVAQILKEPDIERPNGIIISPDDKTLYLIEAHIRKGGAKLIRAYDLQPDGSVTNMRVHYTFGPGRSGDGMTVDTQGNLYVAAGINFPRGSDETLDNKTGVYVISPAGKLLRYIPIPEDLVTNVAFGGADMKTLYVTAGKTLFRVRVDTPGTPR
jgi:gluconolactonase